jgi:hypothetical protein
LSPAQATRNDPWSPPTYSDFRISLDDPTVRTTIPIPWFDIAVAGPDAVYLDGDYDTFFRVADHGATAVPLPKTDRPATRILYADASWVYVAANNDLVRIASDGP